MAMRRGGRPLALLLIAVATALTPTLSASARAFTPTAHELLAEALQASQRAGSLRFVSKTTSGKAVEVVQGVVSAPAASETVTGTGTPFEVELIGADAYVRGDLSALEDSLQLTAAQAGPLVDKWVSVPSTDSAFPSLTAALTITSVLNSFIAASNLKVGKKTKVAGITVIPLFGPPTLRTYRHASGSVALLVSAKKPHLPVGGSIVVAIGKDKTREVAVFKNWGVNVELTPPNPVTTIVSVLGQ
jgi:hypothetical protein